MVVVGPLQLDSLEQRLDVDVAPEGLVATADPVPVPRAPDVAVPAERTAAAVVPRLPLVVHVVLVEVVRRGFAAVARPALDPLDVAGRAQRIGLPRALAVAVGAAVLPDARI